MLTGLHLLSDSDYQALLYSTLRAMEGVSFTPYVDSTGNPTIGIGFNLRSFMQTDVINDLVANLNISDPNQRATFSSDLAQVFSQQYPSNASASLLELR